MNALIGYGAIIVMLFVASALVYGALDVYGDWSAQRAEERAEVLAAMSSEDRSIAILQNRARELAGRAVPWYRFHGIAVARRRFESLLRALDGVCAPESVPHEMMLNVHSQLADAGLKEDLTGLANTLHRLAVAANRVGYAPCKNSWGAYLLARKDYGMSPEEARAYILKLSEESSAR